MKRGTKIRQHDMTDCGAACLASVAAHYGLQMPIARIWQLASTNQRGTNILGLLEASHKLGLCRQPENAPCKPKKLNI
jgi:ATP-binding cassette subfamily B protein